MRKIPTVYVRDADDRSKVTDTVHPDCLWVLAGEGVPTRKYDGTCVMYDGDHWWARREVKPNKAAPDGYVEVAFDAVTGKRVGWEPIEQSPFAKAFVAALDTVAMPGPGTYELVGPKVNGNPERAAFHMLLSHADAEVHAHPEWAPKDLVRGVAAAGWEGIVWHHPDGRMAKLKARDL